MLTGRAAFDGARPDGDGRRSPADPARHQRWAGRSLLQVLEFCSAAGPALFAPPTGGGDGWAARQRTNLRMIAEVALHVLRRYTSGAEAREFDR
eukprot:gene21913-58417_t